MTTRPLVILGAGRIARGLLRQVHAQAAYLERRYGMALPVAAVASSRYIAAGDPYLEPDALQAIAEEGLREGTAVGDRQAEQIDLLRAVADGGERAIVADLTASDGMVPVLSAALDLGCDVVLANKKPLCESYAAFVQLTQHPRGRLAYEATAGAGLPIIETLRRLVDAGDSLTDLTACLSGTLGFLCTELEDGRPLSEIVREARERGFTEPDPREDLGGADVRRKALILARTLGQAAEMDQIPDAPLIGLEGGSVDEWMAGLKRHDQALAERVRAAREQGDVLRYVARLQPGHYEVGLRAVPRSSAVGRLRGPDNIVTLHTRYYTERPLVISGPGAGPEVTAAGVLGDMLRLAGTA